MATHDRTLDDLFRTHKPTGTFRPSAYLSEGDDALYVYFSNEPDRRKRLNERVTLYVSLDSNRIVGCQIKGIGAILEELPHFIEARHGKEKLQLAFVALISSFEDESDRQAFREVGQALANSEELELVCA
jgi:hypothetical protein